MARGFLLTTTFILILCIATMTLSAYGAGKNENDKSGQAYKAAVRFAAIGVFGTIISLMVLIVGIMMSIKEKTGVEYSSFVR